MYDYEEKNIIKEMVLEFFIQHIIASSIIIILLMGIIILSSIENPKSIEISSNTILFDDINVLGDNTINKEFKYNVKRTMKVTEEVNPFNIIQDNIISRNESIELASTIYDLYDKMNNEKKLENKSFIIPKNSSYVSLEFDDDLYSNEIIKNINVSELSIYSWKKSYKNYISFLGKNCEEIHYCIIYDKIAVDCVVGKSKPWNFFSTVYMYEIS